jgi:two-component system, LytTR family, response regulator LytT
VVICSEEVTILLRLAICDDEPEQIEVLEENIVRILFRMDIDADIAKFTSGKALLDSCSSGKGYELIFLDISLVDTNGIDAAKLLHVRDRKALVVFVTGSADYLQRGYEARAFRYLLKPATEETIEDVLKQAFKEIQVLGRDCISFKEKGADVKVETEDIIYFEAQNHRIFLICANATHSFYGRIGDIEMRLKGKGFVRCQKGYLVNALRIRRIGKSEIMLDNGTTLPVSANYLRQTKDTFISVLR